jgi:putative tryptophan/tyrosine transport system substrate-binding protein
MRRREVIAVLGGVAACSVAASAQHRSTPVIGFLSGASFKTMREWVAAFHRGLADAGFAEDRNVLIEYRWAEGNNDRLPQLAMDLVRRKVDIIVVVASTPGALAAKAATQVIPIIFFIGTDPVKVGLVASLAQPGGNVTGVTALVVELFAKTLELMHSVMPSGTTIAALVNPANIPQTATEMSVIQNTGNSLGVRIPVLNASTPDEIGVAFETLVGRRIGALVVSGENFFSTQRDLIVALSARHAVPTIYAAREFVLAGGLMSYGTPQADAFRQVGRNTGRILKGEKAAELPVQQVTKIELAINLNTAKTLGLTIPPTLLARADEVIE